MEHERRPFPLILAAFEVRFSESLSPEAFEHTATSIYEAVGHVFTDSNWSNTAERSGSYFSNNVAEFFDADRSRAVSVRPDQLRLEVGSYEGHERFRDLTAQVVDGLQLAGTVPSFRRVGFRTVDELSLPWSGRDPRQWKGLIADQLLAPLDLFKESPDFSRLSGRLQLMLNEEHQISLSYGALPRPTLRVSPARLRTPTRRSPGGVFMIDIDSFVLGQAPASQESTVARLEELQMPIDNIFKACVTDLYKGYHSTQSISDAVPRSNRNREGM